MLKQNEAVHPKIYADIVRNYKFTEGKTFGEMEREIDEIYRQKVDAYGLADHGYFHTDEVNKERVEKELTEFFDRKLKK
jgi:hypothetical protein